MQRRPAEAKDGELNTKRTGSRNSVDKERVAARFMFKMSDIVLYRGLYKELCSLLLVLLK